MLEKRDHNCKDHIDLAGDRIYEFREELLYITGKCAICKKKIIKVYRCTNTYTGED